MRPVEIAQRAGHLRTWAGADAGSRLGEGEGTMLTRRQLLQRGAVGGTGVALGRLAFATAAPAAVGATPMLRKWVEPLPYLGPTIVATRRPNDTIDASVTVEWRNELGDAFLPNDPTLMGAVMPGDPAPIVTHLHGGENHPQFDGTPLQWFTKDGASGPHYITNTFTYYNEQRASMIWYHDHALGNTRTNVYAGLAGIYFIRDDQDTGEPSNPLGLPAGPYELPLVLQDKTFNADGSMFYPTQGVTAYHPQWVPEFFGDVAVVNAKIWPFVDVEPRRYRLRIVNGSQSRFYNLQFADENSGRPLPFTQIGAEGGLLRAPVPMSSL